MFWKQLLARKSLEKLHAEMLGENRLRRILGPISLTSLGVGAIIGAGIFVMTGRSAATDAGPAVVISFVVAGIGCALAALCYAEFSAMAPVAGSAYTYAYATLGELLAWIIGWDLVLEYAMACACVAASWSKYFNEFLHVCHLPPVPDFLNHDPFSTPGAWFNIPALLITLAVTVVLVIGIRESATTNAVLVSVKVGVVLFVILVGVFFISSGNWFGVPVGDRILPEEQAIPKFTANQLDKGLKPEEAKRRIDDIAAQVAALHAESKGLSAEQADRRVALIKEEIQWLYEETARLPEDEAKLLATRLALQTRALYKFERERDELKAARGNGGLTAADWAAVRTSVADMVADQALEVRDQKMEYASDANVKKAAETTAQDLLVNVIADTTVQLQQKQWISAEEAAALRTAAVEKYAGELRKRRQMTEEEAQAFLARAEDRFQTRLPPPASEQELVDKLLAEVQKEAPEEAGAKWGILAYVPGLNSLLESVDNRVRTPFAPYGFSGIMLGAAIVFFAYIGFDAVSTHSEEAIRPQRDVPFGILASLVICTVLYIAVAAVITGMESYPKINQEAAIAAAFHHKSEEFSGDVRGGILRVVAGLIAVGALAGMTSVLLITFLSQARIFLAMARDRLLPPAVFGAVHERFKTPYISTMLTGGIIALVSAFTPIRALEEMVNIGTLMAFVVVCGAVLLLRIRQPEAQRPFRAPLLFVVAPLGIAVNLFMTLFLPPITWARFFGWLAIGLCIYFGYGMRNSTLGKELRGQLKTQG